ncbi:hypothetical protein HDU67_000453 [Dinochytrium kinnereticum]|nr:hypothetical protein HDU67_000453 [Dinochytrium kinnereticum]
MSSKKKGGSAKKSKKIDAEKLQAEEDERKRRQDEEARLAEVRAKKEREQREQREKEALEQLFLQNKERLEEESQKAKLLIERHNDEIANAGKEEVSEIEWKRFLDCHSLPDPADERGLNTYLSLWKEESLGPDDETSLQNLLNVLPNIEKLCDEITKVMATMADKQKETEYQQLKTHLLELRLLIQVKWDLVTTRVLQHVDHFQVEANENFQHSCGIDRYSFGVWGNLTKNPRHKAIDFGNINLSMTLPKPIALATVSVRMLYETGYTATIPFLEQEGPIHNSVVGGILYFDLFEMPDPPKNFDKWIIRQILSPSGKLKKLTYPFKKPVTEANDEEDEGLADTNIWPTLVSYEIFPSSFIHKESAKIMSWVESEKMWTEENIGDVEINVGKFHRYGPHQIPHHSVWANCKLSQVGLNFLGPRSLKGSDIDHVILKNPAAEEECELGIGLCISSNTFRRSPSNRNVSSSKIVFQFQDPAEKPDESNLWKNLIFDCNYKVGDKAIKIAYISNEADVTDETKFDVSNAEKNNMHSSVFHLLQSQPKAEVESTESSAMFSRTVTDVLRITHMAEQPQTRSQELYILNQDRQWEQTQRRTFANWVNNNLKTKGPGIAVTPQTFEADFSSGEKLIMLLESLSDTLLGKYNKQPRMRIQKVENVGRALEFVKKRGVALTNIGAEDIVDENTKLILGLIWSLILRFDISEISEEGKSAKEGLLLWCQRKTTPYVKDFTIKDFQGSWTDGLALCGLIHRHRPDLIDYWALDKSQKRENTKLAMDVAEAALGIPKLMEVEDLVDIAKPDERSVITYISQFYHAFSAMDKVGVAGRRVAQLGQILLGAWEMQNDYEKRVQKLLLAIGDVSNGWARQTLVSYQDARSQLSEFEKFKVSTKREWIVEKQEIDSLLGNILTKLKTYKLAPYVPPNGLKPQDIEATWEGFLQSEINRKKSLSAYIRETRERMRREFADLANGINSSIKELSKSLASLDGEGDLEEQLRYVRSLLASLDALSPKLQVAETSSLDCAAASILDNQYTLLTYEDLSFDFRLTSASLTKKIAFIENQIIARSVSNVTAAQLDEWTETFKHFDKDNKNALSKDQFRGALQALGIVSDDSEFDKAFKTVSTEGLVSFQPFMEHVKESAEDRTTAADCEAAFRNLSVEKDYITENDLMRGGVPASVVEYFKNVIPKSSEGLNYKAFVKDVFLA